MCVNNRGLRVCLGKPTGCARMQKFLKTPKLMRNNYLLTLLLEEYNLRPLSCLCSCLWYMIQLDYVLNDKNIRICMLTVLYWKNKLAPENFNIYFFYLVFSTVSRFCFSSSAELPITMDQRLSKYLNLCRCALTFAVSRARSRNADQRRSAWAQTSSRDHQKDRKLV